MLVNGNVEDLGKPIEFRFPMTIPVRNTMQMENNSTSQRMALWFN